MIMMRSLKRNKVKQMTDKAKALWSPDNIGEYHLGDLMYNLERSKERRKAMQKDTTQDNQATHNVTHKFYIAGVQHHQMHKVINLLKEGDTLQLVPEPTNRFDPNAIRIELVATDGDTMCGFVPKKFSSEVAAAFEIGTKLECVIVELIPSAKPWEQCKVEIREVNNG